MMGLDAVSPLSVLDLTPAQQRARTMQALTRLLVEQPGQACCWSTEDLHWIDPTSLEFWTCCWTRLRSADHDPGHGTPTFEYGFGGHPIVTSLR